MSERKPDGQRQRRNVGDLLPWVDLPAEFVGVVPELPQHSGLQDPGRDKWRTLWATPMASQWADGESGQVVRYCQLFDIWTTSKDAKVLAEMRHLETALGLTPKARKELRWRVVADGEVVEMNGKPSPGKKRLRVVDADTA